MEETKGCVVFDETAIGQTATKEVMAPRLVQHGGHNIGGSGGTLLYEEKHQRVKNHKKCRVPQGDFYVGKRPPGKETK